MQQTCLNLFILFLQPNYWIVNGIIADPEVLEEEYIPENIPCREAQKKELAFCLSPSEERMRPLDCLCHGKPGTGKTALVKYVLQQIQENTNAFALYVNCWKNKYVRISQTPLTEKSSIIVLRNGKRNGNFFFSKMSDN